MSLKRVLIHCLKAAIASFILQQLYTVVRRISQTEHDELRIWENIFEQVHQVQK